MRYSKSFVKTRKEVPKDATIPSHQLLIRGGFIYQLSAGLYDFLPLGYRVLMKVDKIIKEELALKGVEHLLMPLVHPASLWQETGRYDKVDVLLKFKSRSGMDCVLAPTHEETITDLARHFINTYKDLPKILNQNQWKYRDEIRATGGLLRTREFLMQDAYSFDADKKGLDESFKKISVAYHSIFKRIGMDITVVKADSGTIGGSDSEEFMVISDAGEDEIFVCDKCDYKANMEKAESKFDPVEG
ncbi:MAG: proline--tRNA ligase, partial [Candidatus Gracilibacteria bacterium]